MVKDAQELRQTNVDWIARLRHILRQGRLGGRKKGNRPNATHRSTKESVEKLLGDLTLGLRESRDNATRKTDIEKTIFNAIDQLLDEKVEMSKLSKLEALDKFEDELSKSMAITRKYEIPQTYKEMVEDSLLTLRAEEFEKLYSSGDISIRDIVMFDGGVEALENIYRRKSTDAKVRERITSDLLADQAGCKALARNPRFGGLIVSELKPDDLDQYDLEKLLGPQKVEPVFAEALLQIIKQGPLNAPQQDNAQGQNDPPRIANVEVLKKLLTRVSPKTYNDETSGLGPRVLQWLWQGRDHESICALVKHGVDTTKPARAPGEKSSRKDGIHSGFVQPLQHCLAPFLKEIADSEENNTPLSPEAATAQKVLAVLGEPLVTFTSFDKVRDSPVMREFVKNPGTIWGFESLREPYVQAAKEKEEGKRPLRMMDLWDAIKPTLSLEYYQDLLKDPEQAAEERVEAAIQSLNAKRNRPEFAHLAQDFDAYIDKFSKQAKEILIEFATRMPKGAILDMAAGKENEPWRRFYQVKMNNPEEDESVAMAMSDILGIDSYTYVGTVACRAGLWWAQKSGDPIYYCLDGLEMYDVVDYKKHRNRMIDEYLSQGGVQDGAAPPGETVTMGEMREILKHWDDLKNMEGEPIIRFVQRGRLMSADDAETYVARWRELLKAEDKKAGRTPAPPKAQFIDDLNKIDPRIFAKLPNDKMGDIDARDIVKKFGYLKKVAYAQPLILIKYLIAKCEVLRHYDVIAKGLPKAAQDFLDVSFLDRSPKNDTAFEKAEKELNAQIEACHQELQEPLKIALIRNTYDD